MLEDVTVRDAFHFAGGGLTGILVLSVLGCNQWLIAAIGTCAGVLIAGWRAKGQR